jgi:hypothetical protein
MASMEQQPVVEIHAGGRRLSAAAHGPQDSRLTPGQVAALQNTLATLMAGFRPPEERIERSGMRIDTLEIELGFKIETGTGGILRLLLDASAEASISAKVVWKQAS